MEKIKKTVKHELISLYSKLIVQFWRYIYIFFFFFWKCLLISVHDFRLQSSSLLLLWLLILLLLLLSITIVFIYFYWVNYMSWRDIKLTYDGFTSFFRGCFVICELFNPPPPLFLSLFILVNARTNILITNTVGFTQRSCLCSFWYVEW